MSTTFRNYPTTRKEVMKKLIAKIKPREEKGNISDLFYGFWEQMLVNKFEEYNLCHQVNAGGYEVVKETEKAYQILVPANEIYKVHGDYLGKDWTVWMPKKAFIGF